MEGSANHSFHFICQILGVKVSVKITVLKLTLYLLKLMKSRNKDC